MDVMGVLVLRLVSSVRSTPFGFRVVFGGTSYFVAGETFVVSNVFCPLGWGEVDSIYIHGHGISSVLSGSGGGGKVISSSS